MPNAPIGRIKAVLTRALSWAGLSLLLNLVWEIVQLPLYAIWTDESTTGIANAILHCTAGDTLIAGAAFLLTVAVLRDSDWVSTLPGRGSVIVTFFGFAYTVYSEWQNVYRVGAWTYSPAMPLVFGIGLSPLVQWLVIPVSMVFILRARVGIWR